MTTVAHGPYEHVGAYADLAESEVFDTSGTDIEFCEHCEHQPCIAGGRPYCTMAPRFITVEAVREDINNLKWELAAPGDPLWAALRLAVATVASQAWSETYDGAYALKRLAEIRAALRKAKEAQES